MKQCKNCGAVYQSPTNRTYCPDCSRVLKKTRWQTARMKTCPECGKSFVSYTNARCCSRVCGGRFGQKRAKPPQRKPEGPSPWGMDAQGSMTTDIAAYFMALHGYTLTQAAKELRMGAARLHAHLASNAALANRLMQFYAEERWQRERRQTDRAAANGRGAGGSA
jgi:hypothetical protein